MARVRRRVAFGLARNRFETTSWSMAAGCCGTPHQPRSRKEDADGELASRETCKENDSYLGSRNSRGESQLQHPTHSSTRHLFGRWHQRNKRILFTPPKAIASRKTINMAQDDLPPRPTSLQSTSTRRFRLLPSILSPSNSPVFFLLFALMLHSLFPSGLSSPQDAEHLTAMVGDSIIFNCHIEFPESHPVPYVIQWEKKGVEIPIFIWYENYLHTGDGYEGRVSRIVPGSPSSSNYGLASLNLTRIRESDQGWYLCLVNFLNRSPRQDNKNGTLFHLNVHAPPRFTMTPDDVVYVSLGDPIILSCLAEGTPVPEILWYRDNELVHTSASLVVANDGTELRISSIRQEDIGDYTCAAKNGQGSVRHTTKLVVAGGAVIIVPPLNVSRLEGDKLEMPCEARGLPGNFSVTWYRENHAVRSIPWLESRTLLKRDGTLVISPVHSDDRGLYTCEVTNGIGEPQRASAYVEVEYPARVTFTPTVQYLPLRLSGVVRCHVEANPPFQFITWTKDKRIFDPFETPNVGVLKNGSLLFEKVTQDNQGRYTCTPYNVHGTAGSSSAMEVLVREPPSFVTLPKPTYLHKIDDNVQMICEAQGTPSPRITWKRMDGRALPRDRSRDESGILTLTKLHRSDFGYYECHVSNEVATLVATAHLVIEGTTPHAPYNITTESTEFAVSLEWLPGYSGGSDYSQNYIILYRQEGATQWIPVDVEPPSSTKTSIHNLQPGTSYEFQVKSKNMLGDGMLSNIVKERTKGQRPPDPAPPGPSRATTSPASSAAVEYEGNNEFRKYNVIIYPTDARGSTYIPSLFKPTGPPPLPPENVTITETSDGVLLSWSYPRRGNIAIAYFTIDYCYDDQWKRLTKTELKPQESSYLVKNLNQGKTYVFRVNSHTLTSQASSEKVSIAIQRKIKDKAITAGIVGGILFFIVAIILAVCTVKCVNKRNKRRRREQEKAYSMVACQVTDTRNGSQLGPTKAVPSRKRWISRLPSLTGFSHVERGVASFRQYLCFHSFQPQHDRQFRGVTGDVLDGARSTGRRSEADEVADWLEYGAAELPPRGSRRRNIPARYSVHAEYLQPSGWISRSPEGKFVMTDDDEDGSRHQGQSAHRHRFSGTYSNYPQATAIEAVVESGIYRVGGNRLIWPRPQPILRRELSPLPPPKPPKLNLPPFSHTQQERPLPRSPEPPISPSSYNNLSRHMDRSSQQPAVLAISRKEVRPVPRSSSPGLGALHMIASPTSFNFSDMSSVLQSSSAERSFPSSRLSSSHHYQLTTNTGLDSAATDEGFRRLFPNTVALSPSVAHSRYTRELPALLPIHQQLSAQQESSRGGSLPPSPLRMRTIQAEVHSATAEMPPRSSTKARGGQNEFINLLNTAGRHFHSPPPFRPPPPPPAPLVYQRLPPYTISYPPTSASQRPLATSSPPRSRHHYHQHVFLSAMASSHSPPFHENGPDDFTAASRRRRSPLTVAVRTSPARLHHRPSERNSRAQIAIEYSPQSQSSSSGIDSKNTSQQNQSSQSGSGRESQFLHDSSVHSSSAAPWSTISSPLGSSRVATATHLKLADSSTYVNWPPARALESVESINLAAAPAPALSSLLDASVDNHYEFDTTQSPNETGPQEQQPATSTTFIPSHRKFGPLPTPAQPNIEERVAAMRAEFHAARAAAKRARDALLESAC